MNFIDALLIDLQFLSHLIIKDFALLPLGAKIFYTSVPSIILMPFFLLASLIIKKFKGEEIILEKKYLRKEWTASLIFILFPGTILVLSPFILVYLFILQKWEIINEKLVKTKEYPETVFILYLLSLFIFYITIKSITYEKPVFLSSPVVKTKISPSVLDATLSINLLPYYVIKKILYEVIPNEK